MSETLYKYPRTHHIEGSRLQPGDHDLACVPFAEIAGRPLVVEEKMDGANAALSFSAEGRLLLQSRGHYLAGGPRERHFALLKQWAHTHRGALWAVLGARYVLYGEWLYAKHTIYYDHLPHYFLEFDVLDKQDGRFLDTPGRAALLAGLPLVPVRVLQRGPLTSHAALTRLVRPSAFIRPGHLERLRRACRERGLDAALALRETDPSTLMEGLYIKVEEHGIVTERYKYIRASFLSTILESGSHWLERPIVPNGLRPGVDLFDPSRGSAGGQP
jgi:RNA ligase